MDNTITYIIGARGTGKTPHIVGGDFEPGMIKIYLEERHMSTLVLDTFHHPKYAHLPFLDPKDYHLLSSAKPAAYKTIVPVQHMKEFFSSGALEDVSNTQVIAEDSHKYFDPRKPLPPMVVPFMGDTKQKNNDFRVMTWCWAMAHPDIMRLTNFYTMLPTPDGPEWRKEYLSGCYSKCLKAHQLLLKGKEKIITVDSGI